MIHKEINKHKPHILFLYLRNASLQGVKAFTKTRTVHHFSPHTLHTKI